MKKITLIKGPGREETGLIEAALVAQGYSVETLELSKGEPLPKTLEDMEGLVIIGGVNVFDRCSYPCLTVYFNA